MKKSRIAFLLVCVMLVLALVSCGGKKNPDGSEAPKYKTELLTGWQNYSIVYPSESGATISEAFKSLSDAITAKYGVSLPISDDFKLPFEEAPTDTLEILVGETNRQESINARAEIKANDYIVKFENNRLVILGGSENATLEAVQHCIGYLLKDEGLAYPRDGYRVNGKYIVDTLTIGGVDISEFAIVRGNGMNNSEKLLASLVVDQIANICGVTVPVITANDDEQTYEILIGDTKRAETSKAVSAGHVNIEQTANKLALYGNGDFSSAYLINYLISDVLGSIPEGKSYDIKIDDIVEYEYTMPTITSTNLPIALEDYTDKYGADFMEPNNVLQRFYKSIDELPDEITVLQPIEVEDYLLSQKKQLYVAPDGNDSNPGTIDAPLASIEKALDKIKIYNGGVVWVRGGLYELTSSIDISAVNGTSVSPIFISAYKDETPILTLGKRIPIEEMKNVNYSTDTVAQRIPASAQSSILYVNLKELGWTDAEIGKIGGGSSPKVYINSELCQIARYPNLGEEELHITHVFDTGSVTGYSGSNLYSGWIERVKRGEFAHLSSSYFTDGAGNTNVDWGWSIKLDDLTPMTWVNTGNIWYYGNVFEGWEMDHYNIASFDVAKKSMTSKTGSVYGAKVSGNSPTGYNNYYLYNIIEALDAPGEWFYDPDTGNFYIYRTADIDNASIVYAVGANNFFNVDASSNIVINGLTLDTSGGRGVYATNCDSLVVQRCTIKNTNGYGVYYYTDVKNSAVIYNDFSSIASTMIMVNPGGNDYAHLIPHRNVVQNNHCHNPRPLVVSGIGIGGYLSVVSHNLLEDCRISFSSSAECIVEYNDINGGSKDVSDGGLIYLVGFHHHGNHIRYNHLHNWGAPGTGVYMDDLSSGNYAYYNLIDSQTATRAKGINLLYSSSGHYNVFYGNILVGRKQDYIHESCLYFTPSSHLGYRFPSHSQNLVNAFNSKYDLKAFYKRFPEYELFLSRMEQHIKERSAAGYVRNELEIYLRAPATNIIMNNVVVGPTNPVYQPLKEQINSVTGKNMEPTTFVKDNFTTTDVASVFKDAKNEDYTILDSALADIKASIPDFHPIDVSKAGLTYEK